VFVVFNFFCNGKDFDLLILKPDAMLVVDLKECDKPITATEAGPWPILTGGSLHGNPFQQVRGYRFALIDFLKRRRDDFPGRQKAALAEFDHITAVVAVSPSLHPQSRNLIDPKYVYFRLVGVDKLDRLVAESTSKKFSFAPDELRVLIRDVLHCEPRPSSPAPQAATGLPATVRLPAMPANPQTPPARPPQPPALAAVPASEAASANKLEPDAKGIERGVRLFRYLAQQANLGKAVGISYAGFIAFLHGKESFREAVGRNFLPGDGGPLIEIARKVTDAAGGRIEVTRRNHSLKSGIDTFIWNAARPYSRPDRAFDNPKYPLPYNREDWAQVFPDNLRCLISASELSRLK